MLKLAYNILMLNKKGANMTYLYIGKSSHANEQHSYTIGITGNCHRRAYEKHMVPVWVLPFDSRKEAQRVEKLILSWVRQHYAESFVKFGGWEMENARGWDWFHVEEDLHETGRFVLDVQKRAYHAKEQA